MIKVNIGIEGAREYANGWAMMQQMQIGAADRWGTHAFLRDNMQQFKPGAGWARMTQKECYNNSAIQTIVSGLDFVDGFVSVSGILIRHAWNADGDDALDFTIEDCEEREYFGVRFPAKVATKIINSRAWPYSEGLVGALQKMKPERRAKLLRDAGFREA